MIHQRGQALFNAYNDLRKRLGDIRREISIIGRKNHDAEQTIKRCCEFSNLKKQNIISFDFERLRVELDDWKSKTSKMQEELAKVQAEYREMERKARRIKQKRIF